MTVALYILAFIGVLRILVFLKEFINGFRVGYFQSKAARLPRLEAIRYVKRVNLRQQRRLSRMQRWDRLPGWRERSARRASALAQLLRAAYDLDQSYNAIEIETVRGEDFVLPNRTKPTTTIH